MNYEANMSQDAICKVEPVLERHFGGPKERGRFADFNHRKKVGNEYEVPCPVELVDKLVEVEGTVCGRDFSKNIIVVQDKTGKLVNVVLCENTNSNIKTFKMNQPVYVIAVVEDGCYIAATIMPLHMKVHFESVQKLFGRVKAIRKYYGLSEANKEAIKAYHTGEKYERYNPTDDINFNTVEDRMLLYALNKDRYMPETQATIEQLTIKPENGREKTEERLNYMIKINSVNAKRVPIDWKLFDETLDAEIYGMENVKAMLKDVLKSNEQAGKRGCNILLEGPAGVGKTSIARLLSKVTNLPMELVPFNGMSSVVDLEGDNAAYNDAGPGYFIRIADKHKTTELIIVCDELDKMNASMKEGDPMNVMYQILQGFFVDKFVGAPISFQNTIFIATCNNSENIPEAILNRFDVRIKLEGYDTKTKVQIAKKHLLRRICENFHLGENQITFPDEVLEKICKEYCSDEGVRDLEHNLTHIVRHMIRTGKYKVSDTVSPQDVEAVLDPIVDVTQPGIVLNRNREFYETKVIKEIQKCIYKTNGMQDFKNTDQHAVENAKQKLDYLLACKSNGVSAQEAFDLEAFKNLFHEKLFGMDTVIDEIATYYYSKVMEADMQNANLALVGGMGIGKTTITELIAESLHYGYALISLNGITKPEQIRGFLSTYAGSEPGCIMKAIKQTDTIRTVFLLDELDKANEDVQNSLVDLLDRHFTDAFMEFPINLSDAIFVATANDWNKVLPILRNRFQKIEVKGYTREEKKKIMSGYIIPKLEKKYAASKVSIDMDEQTQCYLLENYCYSFGVRDAEKAMQQIVAKKLVEVHGSEQSNFLSITKDDVKKIMGPEPIPGGNFLEGDAIPGVSKALAVNGANVGSSFAIETVLIPGREGLESTGLLKETTIESVKIAVAYIKKHYPQLLKNQEVHLHFGEGAIPKDGPSAGLAIVLSILSAALNKPITNKKGYDISCTGEISLTGGVFAVGGVDEKVQAAALSGCSTVFVPKQNYERLDLEKLAQYQIDIVPVSHIKDAVERVFPELESS